MNDLQADRLNYPRVSDIVGLFTAKDLANIPADILSHASERGTKVHSLCSGYAKKLWLPEIEEECKPYFESFVLWYDENVDSVILTEERLYDDSVRVTGQIDMLVKTKSGSLALIDLKTSANQSRSWMLQLAAYDHLLQLSGHRINDSKVVMLKKTGCIAKEIAYVVEDLNPIWNNLKATIDLFHFMNMKEVKNERRS